MNVESLDPETTVKATDDWRSWPICEVHADDVIFRRADTESDSGYSYISSALSAVVTNDDTMYIGTSFNSVEDIYLPLMMMVVFMLYQVILILIMMMIQILMITEYVLNV